MLETETRGEGLGTRLEGRMAQAPAFPFLAGAVVSVALSAGLMAAGRRHGARFVGEWAPTLLLMGIYGKLARMQLAQAATHGESAGVH